MSASYLRPNGRLLMMSTRGSVATSRKVAGELASNMIRKSRIDGLCRDGTVSSSLPAQEEDRCLRGRRRLDWAKLN